jgi:hypothetical protein
MRNSLLFAILLLLVSCGSVVPVTMARLYMLDPLTTDPTAIGVALIMPAGLRVAPNSATMSLEITRIDVHFTETFTLVETSATASGIDLPAGAHGSVFGLAAADIPRILALQSKIKDWKSTEPGGTKGDFEITLKACSVDAGPQPDARCSILVRTQADVAFMPLVRNALLSDVDGAELLDTIKPCATQQ